MPNPGDRVFVRPRHGLQVQRGGALFRQYLAPEGQECEWDGYLEARLGEGCIELPKEPGSIELHPDHYPRSHNEKVPEKAPPAAVTTPPLEEHA